MIASAEFAGGCMASAVAGPRGPGTYLRYLAAVRKPHLLFQEFADRYGDVGRRRHRWAIVASTSGPSIHAKCSPRHPMAPPPKGKNA